MKIDFIKIFNYLLVIICVYLELSLPKNFLWGFSINIILMVGLIYLLLNNFSYAIIWLVFGSIFLDLLTPGRFGWIALSIIIPSIPIYFLFNSFFRSSSFWLTSLIFFISSIFSQLIIIGAYKLELSYNIIFSATVSCVFAVIVFTLMNLFGKKSELIKL
ncbi:MAG: hypothetical protein WCW17_03855 [Patescibacteria group bacterium]|jgi:hypothetical protein